MPFTAADLLLRPDLFHLHPLLREYQFAIAYGERWVVLLGDPKKIPLFAARRRYDATFRRDDDAPSRSLMQGRPEWYDDSKFFWPYAPDVVAGRERLPEPAQSWFLWDYDLTTRFIDVDSPRRISRAVIRLIRVDFEMAREMLTAWEGRGGLHKEMVRTEYDPTGLYLSSGLYNMRTALGQARAAFLELAAAVSYMFQHGDDRDRSAMKETYGAQLHNWMVDDCPKIGAMLDLRDRPLEAIPLINLLKHRVPVYYPWDEAFRAKPLPARPRSADGVLNAANFAEELYRACGHQARPSPETWWTDAHPVSLLDRLDLTPALYRVAPNDPLVVSLTEQSQAVLSGVLFFSQSPARALVGRSWSGEVVGHSVLRISGVAEAKLRTFVLSYRIDDIQDVLLEALQRGIQFGLAYPLDYISELQSSRDLPDGLEPPYVHRDFVDSLLSFADDAPRAAWIQYRQRIAEVLGRPHAIAFLLRGGIYWRLALEFGSDLLVTSLLSGPSNSIVDYLHGSSELRGYLRDDVCKGERQVLLGAGLGADGVVRYWWPTPRDFRWNDFYAEEWTPTHERWFQRRLSRIEQPQPRARPLSRDEWNRDLVTWGLKLREDRDEFPEQEDVLRLREAQEAVMGAWDGIALSDIPLFEA